MGIKPPPTFGGNCGLCWPAGKTPATISVAISGIAYGLAGGPPDPAPPNGTHELGQNPGAPCVFFLNDGNFLFSVIFHFARTVFAIDTVFPVINAFVNTKGVCANYFENEIVIPGGNRYYGGKAQLWTL